MCEGDFEENQPNGKLSAIYYDGHTFTGNMVSRKKEGLGKEEWPDGSLYNGTYKNDEFNGNGIF